MEAALALMLPWLKTLAWLGQDVGVDITLGIPSLFLASSNARSAHNARDALRQAEANGASWSCVRDPVWDTLSSGGLSACELLSSLDGQCARPGGMFGGAELRDMCICSTPGYNLYSACIACQRPSSQAARVRWPSMENWLETCPLFVPILPFPTTDELQIPPWAYAACPQGGHFNVSHATQVAEEHRLRLASRSYDAPANAEMSPTSFPVSTPIPVADIAGGVVGGIAFLAVALGLIIVLIRKQRRRAQLDHIVDLHEPTQHQQQPLNDGSMQQTASMYSATQSGTTQSGPWSPYTMQAPPPVQLRQGAPPVEPAARYSQHAPTVLSANQQFGHQWGAPVAAGVPAWREGLSHQAHTSTPSLSMSAAGASMSPPSTMADSADLERIRGEVRAGSTASRSLSDSDVDRIASRVAALMGGSGMGMGAALGAVGIGSYANETDAGPATPTPIARMQSPPPAYTSTRKI